MDVVHFMALPQGFICPQNKHKQGEIVKSIHFFPSSHSLWVMIVKKGYSGQSSAIFWVNFVATSKNNTEIRHSVEKESYLSLFMLVLHTSETLRWHLLDPFSYIVIHAPKKCQTSLLWKGAKSKGKIQNRKPFPQNNQGSSESLFMSKKCIGLAAL